MSTMRAVQILGKGSNAQISLSSSVERPIPKDNELLIRVHSAGITGDEVGWVEADKANVKRIPGLDVSGVIAGVGPDYEGALGVGDAIFAMLDGGRGQGQAEYTIAKPAEVSRKPKTLTHAQAAALPIPVVTAWEALFRHAELQPRARILVTGASGAVGLVLVQIAKQVLDAQVVALASASKQALLHRLGAAELVDYTASDWETRVGKVDAVFDTVGSEVLSRSWRTLKEKGVIVTVADPAPQWATQKDVVPSELEFAPGARHIYFILSPDAAALARVADMIDGGALQTLPVMEYPASQAVEAWAAAAQRNRQGKVVINFVSEGEA